MENGIFTGYKQISMEKKSRCPNGLIQTGELSEPNLL